MRRAADDPLANDGSDTASAHLWMQHHGAEEALQAGLTVRK
jgi:hypothetical protein